MTRLISFDIGIRNLAYCIFDISQCSIVDWNVIDISLKADAESSTVSRKCNCLLQQKQKKTKKPEEAKVCGKNAKYTLGEMFYCEKHAKGLLIPTKEFEKSAIKKLSVDSLIGFQKKHGMDILATKENRADKIERILKWIEEHVLQKIVEVKRESSPDFVQIGKNMVHHLAKLDLENMEYVIIENQISPIANKMKTVQGMLAQIFILQNVPTIEFISSSNKLRDYLGETGETEQKNGKTKGKKKEQEEKDKKGKKEEKERKKQGKKGKKEENGENGDNGENTGIANPNYKQHKKDGIAYCLQWLKDDRFSQWKSFFEQYPIKQDDLADSFLQGIWYFRKKLRILE
jgi:hypothetical protein